MKINDLKAEDRAQLKKDGYKFITYNKEKEINGIFKTEADIKVEEPSGIKKI